MNDDRLTDRLAADLAHAAGTVTIRPGDVDGVIGHGRRRSHRQRTVLGLAALVAVTATTAGAIGLANDPKPTVVGTQPGTERGDLGLTWRRVEPDSALGFARALTASSPLYALSTGPGERFTENKQPSRVLWRSDDGIEWQAATTFGDDLYLSDLDSGALATERLYAVGTAPATARISGGPKVSDVVVGWSDDGGDTFQKTVLPVDWAALSTHTNPRVGDVEIASGPGGVIAVATLSVELDVRELLPDGERAPHGWATTDSGVDVLGPRRDDVCPDGEESRKSPRPPSGEPGEVPPTYCEGGDERNMKMMTPQESNGVVRSYTWDELGVTGDLRDAARRRIIAYRAEPGSTGFERVDLPDIPNAWGESGLVADGNGFALVAVHGADRYGIQPSQSAILTSADGRTWQRGTGPEPGQWVVGAGLLNGRMAFVAGDHEGGHLTVQNDSGGWTTTALRDVVDPAVVEGKTLSVTVAGIGEFGIAVNVMVSPDEERFDERELHSRLLVSRDGRTWQDFDFEELSGRAKALATRITVTDTEVLVAVAGATKAEPNGTTSTEPALMLVGSA